MKDELASEIRVFLQEHGIDPLYFVTILGIVIMISYKNQIKEWDEQLGWQKGIILSTAFGTAILVLISFLRLIGVINF
jgi:hypothetical protein